MFRQIANGPTTLLPERTVEKKECPALTTANGAPIGHFDQARVAQSIAVLQGAGLIQAGLTPDKVVDFSFIGAS